MNNRYRFRGNRIVWVDCYRQYPRQSRIIGGGRMKYEVRDVVCDYGVYENGELKLILNSRRIAEKIVQLLKEDERNHRELNPMDWSDTK